MSKFNSRSTRCIHYRLSAVWLAMSLAVATLAAEPEARRLVMNLTDGTRLVGQTTLETLPVNGSSLGRVKVPLARIKSIKFARDSQPARITLQNGDQIQGTTELEAIVLQTSFGKASIPLSLVTQLDVLSAAGDAGGNLLVNGSFEDGPVLQPDAAGPIDVGSDQLPGWEVTRGQIDRVRGFMESDGMCCLDLNGSPGIGGVAQKFDTIPGRRNQVKFMMAGNPSIARVTTLRVTAAGQSKDFSFDTAGKTRADMGWVTNEWTFAAEEATTRLEIYSTDRLSPREGPALDNVTVTLTDQ